MPSARTSEASFVAHQHQTRSVRSLRQQNPLKPPSRPRNPFPNTPSESQSVDRSLNRLNVCKCTPHFTPLLSTKIARSGPSITSAGRAPARLGRNPMGASAQAGVCLKASWQIPIEKSRMARASDMDRPSTTVDDGNPA